MAKAKGRVRSASTPTAYVVEIEKWGWSYSFGLNPIRREPDPYMEFRHLALTGTLLRPRRLEKEKVELTVIPSHDLDVSSRLEREPPLGVGSLERNRNIRIIQGHLSVPQDVLGTILSMLAVDRLKFIVMNGTEIGRSHAMIRSFRFDATLSEDDLDDSR